MAPALALWWCARLGRIIISTSSPVSPAVEAPQVADDVEPLAHTLSLSLSVSLPLCLSLPLVSVACCLPSYLVTLLASCLTSEPGRQRVEFSHQPRQTLMSIIIKGNGANASARQPPADV